MDHLDSKGRQLHRCHHCATPVCSLHGKRALIGGERLVQEGGCSEYTLLDPALRPNKWVGKRRIKKLTTIKITQDNIDFVKAVVLPSNKKKFVGALNRGIEECIMEYFKLNGPTPRIGKLVRGTGNKRLDKKMTFSPECKDAMDNCVAHWKETENQVSRSQLINFIIEQTRDMVAKMREG